MIKGIKFEILYWQKNNNIVLYKCVKKITKYLFYDVGGNMADKNFIVDNIDNLTIKMKELREAQREFASYSQEQVDKIFYEVSMAANKARLQRIGRASCRERV